MTKILFLIAAFPMGLVPAQERVENPEYKAWASFKPGSYVKYREIREGKTLPVETELTLTLLELTGEKAVLEVHTVRSVGDNKAEMPSENRSIPATIQSGELPVPDKEGIEEIQVAGKELMCSWVEYRVKKDTRVRIWAASYVPGGVIRKRTTMEGRNPSVTILDAVAWKRGS